MQLKFMYITNNPIIAQIAESAGVDRIFVDMEYIGKSDRQGGMDTVQSHHTLEDVKNIASSINKAELLVRVNPIHNSSKDYISSKDEINQAILNGAKILMLPYFKTLEEVKKFIKLVNGRVKTSLLIETPEAVNIIDDILNITGIDEIHIGLNDLSLGYKKKFMFELLVDGTVAKLCEKIRKKNIPYGFGGIAAIGKGTLPSERIIIEHYRLGSSRVILSRSFCNADKINHVGEISNIFINGIKEIRDFEKEVNMHYEYFYDNYNNIKNDVKKILENETK